jgi:hypothetical protein
VQASYKAAKSEEAEYSLIIFMLNCFEVLTVDRPQSSLLFCNESNEYFSQCIIALLWAQPSRTPKKFVPLVHISCRLFANAMCSQRLVTTQNQPAKLRYYT